MFGIRKGLMTGNQCVNVELESHVNSIKGHANTYLLESSASLLSSHYKYTLHLSPTQYYCIFTTAPKLGVPWVLIANNIHQPGTTIPGSFGTDTIYTFPPPVTLANGTRL